MGGKPLSLSGIYHIFNNPFYYGWFESPRGSGQWHQGKHEPMVTEAEFDRVQTLLGRHSVPRPITNLSFAFTGLIRCGECTGMITAEEKHQLMCSQCRFKFAYRHRNDCPRCATPVENMANLTILHYTYYHCTRRVDPRCTQKGIRDLALEQQIDGYLSRIQISPRFKDWAVRYLHELHEAESRSRNQDTEARQKVYAACLQQLDQLVKLKTAPENREGQLLSDAEYREQRLELVKEKSRLEELLDDRGQRRDQAPALSEGTFEFACTARSRFAKGDFQTKKEILAAVGSNLVLHDKRLRIEATEPILILETSLSYRGAESGPLEPEKGGSTKGADGETDPDLPSVLRNLLARLLTLTN